MNHPKLASYPIPQILHFQEELPEMWEQAEKLLQPKDYLYHRLTGTLNLSYCCMANDFATSWLILPDSYSLNCRNPSNRTTQSDIFISRFLAACKSKDCHFQTIRQ